MRQSTAPPRDTGFTGPAGIGRSWRAHLILADYADRDHDGMRSRRMRLARRMTVPLSVRDLASVRSGSTHAEALAETLAAAREADRLGYRRFWVAEHHSMPAVAS